MIFKPVRLLIIIGIAFTSGVVYERQKYKKICGEIGGTLNGSICTAQVQE
tara:strand:+ start:178 stop:327 length:150 start_codon:yes stop_codon:yes gene_type:complete